MNFIYIANEIISLKPAKSQFSNFKQTFNTIKFLNTIYVSR